MILKQAQCPNCGGELQLPSNKLEATCIYCDTKIIVSEAIKAKEKDIEPLLNLMQDAYEASGDGDELLKYCNKVLEINSNQAIAMFYKGMANCWMNKILEGIVFINKSIKIDSSDEFKLKAHNMILEWSAFAFEHFYFTWNAQPGSNNHCDNKLNRMQYAGWWLEQLDNEYNESTTYVIELVECAISILPDKIDGSKLIIEKLSKVSNMDWSEVINQHKNKLKSLGYEVPSNNKVGCFIATATMGAYDHPTVVDLRLFRDNWLLKRQWGISFTNWYYTHGPKAARVIEKSYVLRKVTFFIIIKPLQLLTKIVK
jgi:hypothetical protein